MSLYANDMRYWRIKNQHFVGDTVSVTDQHGHYTKTFSVPFILAAQIREELLFALARDKVVWEIQIRSGSRKKIATLNEILTDHAHAEKVLLDFIGAPTEISLPPPLVSEFMSPENEAQQISKVHSLEWDRVARNLNQSIRQINAKRIIKMKQGTPASN